MNVLIFDMESGCTERYRLIVYDTSIFILYIYIFISYVFKYVLNICMYC